MMKTIRMSKIGKRFLTIILFGLMFLCFQLDQGVRNVNPEKIFKNRSIPQIRNIAADNDLINCKAVLEGNQIEMLKATRKERFHRNGLEDFEYLDLTKNCSHFRKFRSYILYPLTREEENFSIAFTIMVYKDVEQFERLLRAIYAPQNSYCIHVDAKAPDIVFYAISSIARCFKNVFLASKRIKVAWGTFSVLESDLTCMRDLLEVKKWKYLINLTAQEFPLKNNYELVKILKAYGGANDIKYDDENERDHRDFRGYINRITYMRDPSTGKRNSRRLRPPPHKVFPVKASLHIIASRKFMEFAIKNEVGKNYLNWVKYTGLPDENYFGTLQYNRHLRAPGSFNGTHKGRLSEMFSMTRLKVWSDTGPGQIYPCSSKFVRHICIFKIADLPLLYHAPQIFANKIDMKVAPSAYDCLEEWHFNKTREYFLKQKTFDAELYKNFPFVKDHL